MKRFLIFSFALLMLITGCSKQSRPQFPQTYEIHAQTDGYELVITPQSMTLQAKQYLTNPITVSYTDRTVNFEGMSVSLDQKTEKLLFIGQLIGMIYSGDGQIAYEETEFVFTGSYMESDYTFTVAADSLTPVSLTWGELSVKFT